MNRKIVVGIASFGMSGKIFHAPLLVYNANFRIKRIIERSKNEAKGLYPDVLVSKSVNDLLEDDEIELIVVNTPDVNHYELSKKCIDAGKHIVIEKPFTQTSRQAEELIELAEKKNIMLSVFQNRRWDGDFLTVQKIVKEERLGRLSDYEAHFDRYRNHIQAGTWKEKSSGGGGVLTNLGSHMIDQVLVLFGMPEAVTAHLKIMRTGGEVDDWYDIRLHYSDSNVQLKSSLLVREPGPRYILHGMIGSFLKWGLDPQEEDLKMGKKPNNADWGKEQQEWWGMINTEKDGVPIKEKVETLAGNYPAFYNNIYDCIVNGKELAVKPVEALNVIRIIEIARKSNDEKKTILL
jgi:scyllo-inositol 2-dehydrogenase (NADP+)